MVYRDRWHYRVSTPRGDVFVDVIRAKTVHISSRDERHLLAKQQPFFDALEGGDNMTINGVDYRLSFAMSMLDNGTWERRDTLSSSLSRVNWKVYSDRNATPGALAAVDKDIVPAVIKWLESAAGRKARLAADVVDQEDNLAETRVKIGEKQAELAKLRDQEAQIERFLAANRNKV